MDAPFSVSEHGAGTKGTMFIFGGWRTHQAMYSLGIRQFNKLGWRCVLFLPKPKLIAINSPYQDIVAASADAETQVARYIARAPKDMQFLAMGISFGTLFAAAAAKDQARITRLVLSAPFGDFAEHVGLWNNHWYFGRVLRSQPTDMQTSAAILNQIAAAKYVERLAGKQIMLLYGDADNVTHTAVAQKFIDALIKANPHAVAHVSRGGHNTAIFKNYRWVQKNQRDFFAL